MLRNNKEKICVFFAADYDLRLGTKLSAAADAICESREPERAGVGANSFYDFQWPTARERLLLGPKRTAIEILGLAPWVDDFDALFDAVDSAFAALDVSIVHRAGFKVVAYLPLQMNHAEALDLMFGSFLAEKEMLSPVLGERLDPLVLIEAEFSGFKYVLQWTALTPEQASRTFLGLGNLDKFVDQRLIDTSVKEFHDRIAHADCMLFDLDLFQNEVPAAKLREFAKSPSIAPKSSRKTACGTCVPSRENVRSNRRGWTKLPKPFLSRVGHRPTAICGVPNRRFEGKGSNHGCI